MNDAAVDQERLRGKFATAQEISAGVWTAGAIHIGDKVGLYRAMTGAGPLTTAEVAERAALNERFVREWLYQQSAAGIIDFVPPDRFELTAEAAIVFGDDNPMSMVGAFARLPSLVASFQRASAAFAGGVGQTFAGVWDVDGIDRGPLQVWARTALVPQVLPKLGDIVARLSRGGRVADVGCGAGGAPLAIAKAFPAATVHGYDNWQAALDLCETGRNEAGLQNVSFFDSDRRPLPGEPTYDLILTMDCLHDMARPDVMAKAIRSAIQPEGFWFIVEPDGRPDFASNLTHPAARMAYAASISLCLQSGTSQPDGLGLGTFGLHEARLRELVTEAGFATLERLPGLEHPFNAYYVARPERAARTARPVVQRE